MANRRIARNFFNHFELGGRRTVHCFISLDKLNEVDTTPIFHGIWKRFPQIHTVVPRINGESGNLDPVTYCAETEMERNVWGIAEPIAEDVADPRDIDIVLTPGLCFDSRGHRVGYGKGYYDRFLRECRPDCLKAGLSFFEPIDIIDDINENDTPVDMVITPAGVVQFAKQAAT